MTRKKKARRRSLCSRCEKRIRFFSKRAFALGYGYPLHPACAAEFRDIMTKANAIAQQRHDEFFSNHAPPSWNEERGWDIHPSPDESLEPATRSLVPEDFDPSDPSTHYAPHPYDA